MDFEHKGGAADNVRISKSSHLTRSDRPSAVQSLGYTSAEPEFNRKRPTQQRQCQRSKRVCGVGTGVPVTSDNYGHPNVPSDPRTDRRTSLIELVGACPHNPFLYVK